MVVFPNCKINLGLHVISRRDDGFHNLETVFYPLPIADALEIITHPNKQEFTGVEFSCSGLAIDGPADTNLCIKAYQLLQKDFAPLPPVKMHLHKAIPMGAGLGGGSADGAFTLLALNKKYQLGLTEQQLIHYALQLGSDCPFFIVNKPSYATGRGEELTPVPVQLKGYTCVMVNPGIHVNTGWAFKAISPAIPDKNLFELIQTPVVNWRHCLTNDFQVAVAAAHPAIATICETLYNQGAVYAAMSGSGSTCFGIFEAGDVFTATFPAGYFIKQVVLD